MNEKIEKYLSLKLSAKEFINEINDDKALYNEICGYMPTEQTINDEKWKDFVYALTLKTHNYDLSRIIKYRFSNGANAFGKSAMYDFIYKILEKNGFQLKYNEYYRNRCKLLMDIVPEYVGGDDAEAYIDDFISTLPNTLTEEQKKKQIKKMIKDEFICKTKSKPKWVQEPEWPVDGKPMMFVSQSKNGDKFTFVFENPTTGNKKEIIQYA